MTGYSTKPKPRFGHLPPFLAALRKRANLSQVAVAQAIGCSYQPVYQAETLPRGASREIVEGFALACGATPDELARVRVLDALDRGHLPLPDGCTEDRVRAAMAALETPAQ